MYIGSVLFLNCFVLGFIYARDTNNNPKDLEDISEHNTNEPDCKQDTWEKLVCHSKNNSQVNENLERKKINKHNTDSHSEEMEYKDKIKKIRLNLMNFVISCKDKDGNFKISSEDEWMIIKKEINNTSKSSLIKEECDKKQLDISMKNILFLLELEADGVIVGGKKIRDNEWVQGMYTGHFQEGNISSDCIIKSPSEMFELGLYNERYKPPRTPVLYKSYVGMYLMDPFIIDRFGTDTIVLQDPGQDTYGKKFKAFFSLIKISDYLQNLDEMISIIIKIAEALDDIHCENFAHGSITRDNIIIENGECYFVNFENGRCFAIDGLTTVKQVQKKDWIYFRNRIVTLGFEKLIQFLKEKPNIKDIDPMIYNDNFFNEIKANTSYSIDEKDIDFFSNHYKFQMPYFNSAKDVTNYLMTVRKTIS